MNSIQFEHGEKIVSLTGTYYIQYSLAANSWCLAGIPGAFDWIKDTSVWGSDNGT